MGKINAEMVPAEPAVSPLSPSPMRDIVERTECGLIVLSPARKKPVRRILHVSGYAGAYVWNKIKRGHLPGHQLIGCIELVRMGYEVAIPEPLPHLNLLRRPLPHDLRLLSIAKEWLKADDIIFSGHTLLYWLPLLKKLRLLNRRIVSLTYAREPLDFCKCHDGIISLTPAGADSAKKMAPGAKVAHLGWGVDLPFFPAQSYNPEWFLSCGIANRDFQTLSNAASLTPHKLRVICPGLAEDLQWPSTATVIDGGRGWLTDKTKSVSVRDLLTDHFPRSAAALIIMKHDPTECTANGFTNLMEAMALAQPVIVTRTGALPGELDVERAGCGLHVPANDPKALAEAINSIAINPRLGQLMGEKGRQLCETRYNLDRYARDLHNFFETL